MHLSVDVYLNKYKINSLTVTNQVGHFCKTPVIFGQVPDFIC